MMVGRAQSPQRKHSVLAKTLIFSLAVVAGNVLGNYALARGLRDVGIVISWSPMPYIHTFTHPWVIVGVLFSISWVVARLALLSWADLSYVLPVTSFAYVLSAVAGEFGLGERVTPLRWGGIAVITIGVALVALTYPETPELYHEAPDDDGSANPVEARR